MSKFLVVLEFIVLETFFSRLFLTLDFFVRNLELVAAPVKLNASQPENHPIPAWRESSRSQYQFVTHFDENYLGEDIGKFELETPWNFLQPEIPTMYWGTWNSLVAEFHHPSSYLHSFLEGNMLLGRKAAKKLISTLGKVEFARKNWIQRATEEKLRFYKIEQNTTALHHLLQQRWKFTKFQWNVGKFEATFLQFVKSLYLSCEKLAGGILRYFTILEFHVNQTLVLDLFKSYLLFKIAIVMLKGYEFMTTWVVL